MASGKEAIFLGGSGLVGGLVVDQMLESDVWDEIHLVVRKPSNRPKHPKLHEIVIPDLTSLPEHPTLLELAARNETVDAAFVTLGVNEIWDYTIQQILDIEVTLTRVFTEYCSKQLHIPYVALLSGVDAERGKPFSEEEAKEPMWSWKLMSNFVRAKGMVEDEVVKSGIPYRAFYRPANFETDEYRFGGFDKFLQYFCTVLNWVSPSKYHSIHVKDLSKAMVRHAEAALKEVEQAGGSGSLEKEVILMYTDFFNIIDSPGNSNPEL